MADAGKRVFEFQWAGAAYWGESFEDDDGGCAGIELHRELDGKQALVAKLTYWDSTGQYFLETVGTDLPLGVINRLIAATTSIVGVNLHP